MTQRARRAALLPVAFFARPADQVARDLLGQLLVVEGADGPVGGRIVETEAYLGGDDPASHAAGLRRNERNSAIYGPPGSWYVYLSYGMHWCANLVAGPPGQGAAVLLRALEPLEGLDLMGRRRGTSSPRLLCAGPGRLCQALGIDRRLDGLPMRRSAARVLGVEGLPRARVRVTPRIGITKAADWPLRFLEEGSPWVSGPRGRKD